MLYIKICRNEISRSTINESTLCISYKQNITALIQELLLRASENTQSTIEKRVKLKKIRKTFMWYSRHHMNDW